MTWSLYTQGKISQYSWQRRLGRTQRASLDMVVKRKNSLPAFGGK